MMPSMRTYLIFLLLLVLAFFFLRTSDLAAFVHESNWLLLLAAMALYLCSHLLRILRLMLLTLDERDKALPLAWAHAMTAFPSSFLPFKIGELLRLGAIYQVYGHKKALAVWLVERFGDILIITALIISLYWLNVEVPSAMQALLIIFAFMATVGLLALFAIAKVFVYLNRHLILASLSTRGLALLRVSHAMYQLELEISKSIEGRLLAFLLLSILIWTFEILALSLFIKQLSMSALHFADIFTSGLLASLPGGSADIVNGFGLYQSMALVILTLSLFVFLLMRRFRYLGL